MRVVGPQYLGVLCRAIYRSSFVVRLSERIQCRKSSGNPVLFFDNCETSMECKMKLCSIGLACMVRGLEIKAAYTSS